MGINETNEWKSDFQEIYYFLEKLSKFVQNLNI